MKRKLSALLAIVLAVVMVFPTAVFVGAEDPVPTPEDPKIEKFNVTRDGKTISDNTTIDLSVGEKTVIIVDTDATDVSYSMSANNAAVKITAEEQNKKYTLEGWYANNNSTLTISAKKTGATGTTPDVKVFTINLACHTPTVKVDTIKVDKINGSAVSENFFSVKANTELTNAVVSAIADNGEALTTEKVQFSLEAEGTYSDKLLLTAASNGQKLWIKYTFENIEDLSTKSGTVSVNMAVSGTYVEDLSVARNNSAKVHSESVTVMDFAKDDIVVYADGNIIKYPNFEITVYNKNTNEMFVGDITRENCDALKFNINFDGNVLDVDKEVKDYVEFKKDVLVDFDIDFTGASLKKYYVGQILSEVPGAYEGVVVKIYYDTNGDDIADGDPDVKEGSQINGLGLVFEPFSLNSVQAETVKVTYKEGVVTKTKAIDITALDVEPERVISIISNTADMKKEYKEGETLDLSKLTFTIEYNNGKSEKIEFNKNTNSFSDSRVTCTPGHGTELNKTLNYISVKYRVEGNEYVTDEIDISVTDAPTAAKSIKEVKLLSSANAKREYFIGEEFEPDGFEFLIVYSDATTEVKDLKSYSVTVDSNKYDNSDDEFTAAMDGDLKVKFNITYNSKTYSVTLTLPDIVVTKRPTLESITASTNKVEYMEGEAPQVKDFVITAKYDDKSQRIFEVSEDATGATKTSYSATINGVYYVLKLTPTSVDADTETIKVTYSEQISGSKTVSKTDEVEIEVTIPDAILTYYDTSDRAYVTEAFDDLYDALEKAEDVADNYTSYYANRIPEIELRRDVVMAADFPTTESIDIDLNGHSLTMIRGEVYVASNAASDIEVTFANSAKEDGKLVYSNDEDDTVIIAQNDTYTIDRNTDSDGKYEVTISSVKNGKVTGPTEVTHGHDAQFTITPDEDYQIASIKVNNKTQTIPSDGKLIVKDVQAKLTVTVTFSEKAWENPFTDVYKSATYYKSIQFVYENGLFSGMSATKFQPDTTMTRAMFVTVLGRLAGIDADEAESRYGTQSSFSDVSATDASISYAVPYIKWATDNGLIEGYGNGKFGPKDNITHIQMYVLMQRYAAFIERLNTSATGTNIAANDVKDIPTWDGAYEAVEYAAKEKFLITSSNRLTPNGNAKRSELAMLLEKFCTNVLEWDD